MTGLRVTSTLRLHRLITVTTALIRRELGELPPSMKVKVTDKLKELFGLTPKESSIEQERGNQGKIKD
jgi:mRNA interferase MazF